MRYSPYPAEKYALCHDGGFLNPLGESAEDEAIWNLIWLSIPHIDSYLNLAYEDFETYRSLSTDFPFIVKVDIVEDLKSRPGLRKILASMSPAEFLEVLTPSFYTSLRLYKRGGDDWLTTVRYRAEAAQARLDTEVLAEKAENVMLVDFKLRNGNLQRIEPQPEILADPLSLLNTKPTAESPGPEMGRQNERFANNRDGTVTDTHTGRMWMRCLLGQCSEPDKCTDIANTYTWENAVLIRHRHAGHDDWRLPSADELESVFGRQGDRAANKAAFPWLVYEDTQSTCLWSSTTWDDETGLAVNSYYPNRGAIAYYTTEYLDYPIQVLLVRGNEYPAGAVIDENTVPLETTNEYVLDQKESSSVIDNTNATIAMTLLHNLIDRFDRLEAGFEVMMNRIESLTNSPHLAHAVADMQPENHLQSPALSGERLEKAIKSLLSGQLASMQHIEKKIDLRSDQSISLINSLLAELQRLREHVGLPLRAKDVSVKGAAPDAITVGLDSITGLLTYLVELQTISLGELRTLILPLDMLPNAVIDDINERALDLIGEPALVEDGDNVIVQREILLQVITDMPLGHA